MHTVVRGDGVGVAVLQRSRLGGSTRSRETYKSTVLRTLTVSSVWVHHETPHTTRAAGNGIGRASTALLRLRRGLHALNHMPHYGPRRARGPGYQCAPAVLVARVFM